MEKPYNFYPVEAFAVLQKHATEFLEKVGTKRVVLGISGGRTVLLRQQLLRRLLDLRTCLVS